MTPRLTGPSFLCVFALAFAGRSSARAETAPPVSEIVQKAVARDDVLRQRRTTFKCDQTVKVDRFDSTGKIIKTDTVRTVHIPTRDIAFKTEVKADSAKSGEDVAKSQNVEAVMDLRKLSTRFEMSLAGEEPVRGRVCYVVRYSPKANQSSSTREEKVVSNLKGRFWIAKDDFSILQSDGTLSSPVTVALIASVNRLDFQFHSRSLPDGDIVPADFNVYMAVKAPFYDFRERKTTTQENWRLR